MSESRTNDCSFCSLPRERIVDENASALALADAFPVSPGHTLVIPRRHTISFFDLTEEELSAVYELLLRAKRRLADRFKPDGYNICVNEGENAGQTVRHLHIHLIPRFAGDVAEPQGGVRNVIPGAGPYQEHEGGPGSSEARC